jgi:Bacterial SH3 domain
MKRLLLSLCLVGAVFPGHTRHVLETAQAPPASINQYVEARAVSPSTSPAMLNSIPQLPNSGIEPVAVRSLAMTGDDTQSTTPPSEDIQKAPLPTTGESSETSVPLTPEGKNPEAIWVVVILGATVHSGPSVSTDIVRYYSVGTELELIDHQQGWFQVLDPATSQRGWIYEKYYLQAIRGPGQGIAVLQEPPKRKVVNAGKSTPHAIPHVRSAKSLETRPRKKTQPVIASAPRYRDQTIASILDSALRRW